MRPPSYYASIVKSNTGNSSYGSNYSSSDYSRTSSQQLRSSLSSPSSSNYVSRSHLPFVPQSTLVAHCFTGVGSSTRPYGSSTPSSSSTSSSSYRTSSRAASPASYSSTSYSASRPSSTNRRTYTGNSTTSGYSSSSSSNYLSPSSAALASRSYPRSTTTTTPVTTTTSSYYKPIRLRERPLLTQISRQLPSTRAHQSYTPLTSTRTTSYSTSASDEPDNHATKSEGASDEAAATSTSTRLAPPSDEDTKATKAQAQLDESSWSSDIGRNISRNKYLIKFREFDKRGSRASVDVEATIQLPPVEVGLRDTSHDRDSCVPDRDATVESPFSSRTESLTVEHTMRLPTTPEPVGTLASGRAASVLDDEKEPATCDIERPQELVVAEPKVDLEAKREPRKNIKLKLKPLGGLAGGKKKKSELAAEATTTTTVTDSVPKVLVKANKIDVELKPMKIQPEVPPDAIPKPKEAKKSLEKPAADKTPPAPEPPQKQVKVVEKKVVKTSITKDKTSRENLIEDNNNNNNNNKENKSIAPKPRIGTAATADGPAPPCLAMTPKVRRGSKATPAVEDKEQRTTELTVEAAVTEQKSKTKIIKKKKKTKQEDDGAVAPNKTAPRRRSSAIPKEIPPQVNEAQVTPATPAADTPPTPSKQPSRIRFREYNINDFNFLTVLGHGGWGFVILAELKEHDACFAVKCIKKITIVEDDDYDSIMIERKMLTLGNIHPFICKLFCTFETPGYLFFVMEYCAGGDLMFHVQHEGKFTESRCRFYAAEIICAIRFLHNRHIIYRDLKLDNILLDELGHIRLVDFGMCQCRTYREEMLPSNFCGTPEYISPEIIKGVPYNHSVDWWSFGVLLYEMAVGKMPFRGNDENELLWNVCYEQIHYPMFLTKELTSLLKSLLEREPTKRMGMATCKAGDIYDQPFFRSVDWKAVEELRVEPPFVPEVRSNRDVSNFDSDFTESTCELSPVDEGTLARIDQKQFEKFPYTNPDIFIFDPTQRNSEQQRSTAIL